MKRRFFCMVITLLVLLAVIPAAALADDTSYYEVTLEGSAPIKGSIEYSTDNENFYAMNVTTAALTWITTESGINSSYSAELESETNIYIKCTPDVGYTVRSSSDNRTIFGKADAPYTFKLAEDSSERVAFVDNNDASMTEGNSYNELYDTSALQSQIHTLEDEQDEPLFYATDAYGNRLGDEITIARGGSFFLRFRVNQAAKDLMDYVDVDNLPVEVPTIYTDLSQLFGNVGWNLETINGVIEYTNEEPSEDNNWSGGIHIDTLANCGKTVYLDFYISPKVNAGSFLPVNWATMSHDYVIKKVIKVTVEDSENTSSAAVNTSVTMTKPIPEGYNLTVTPFDSDILSEKSGYSSGNVENYGVDFTMKNVDAAEYPVTNNSVQVVMPVPEALEGCAEYKVSYLDPNTDTIKYVAAANAVGGELAFTTTHFSQLIITGTKLTHEESGGGSIPSITIPVSSGEGSVNVRATISRGTAAISVTDTQLNKIISSFGSDVGTVKLDISALKADKAVIPAKLIAAAVDDTGSEGMEVTFSSGSVSLDKTALESVGSKSITVSVENAKTSELTAAQKESLGDQADTAIVVDVNVLVGGVKTSSFGDGILTISIPYTPKAGDDTSKLTVWNIKDDGSIENKGGYYNAVNKSFVFKTTHLSQYALVSYTNPFTDIIEGAYYNNAVAWAVTNGITEGTSDTTFSPNDICNRAQMVTFLWRAMGSPKPTDTICPFTDVSTDAYYDQAVLWADEKGITSGTSASTFSPDMTVSRAQAATFLWRAAGEPATTTVNTFNDVFSDSYYTAAILWAAEKDITSGTGTATFSPDNDCTRAEIVTFLYRYISR